MNLETLAYEFQPFLNLKGRFIRLLYLKPVSIHEEGGNKLKGRQCLMFNYRLCL